jgi:hypothetical protein
MFMERILPPQRLLQIPYAKGEKMSTPGRAALDLSDECAEKKQARRVAPSLLGVLVIF